ncbi:MAG TPA: hypothetical protein VMW65_03075 [Chloroflexota bacterium]|nr:hypothetical protein [Chloroflexota bacterium]
MQQSDQARRLGEQVRAWWTSVLIGQVDQPYPVHRDHVQARINGGVLVVTGEVPSEDDRQDIQAEIHQLIGNGITEVRDEVVVVPDARGESGLLVQTLVGTFENEEQARFAATYLQSQSRVRPVAIHVLASRTEEATPAETVGVRQLLTEEHWQGVRNTLAAHRAILVVTVDETRAFETREILDEETRSLETVVLPPEPIGRGPDIRKSPGGASPTRLDAVDLTGSPPIRRSISGDDATLEPGAS